MRTMREPGGTAPARDHSHEHADPGLEDHGHSHGLVDPSIKRSRAGLRVVAVSLALLAVTAIAQGAIYIATDSVALLADLIHNAGDALTAVPLGAAFLLRSERAEGGAGIAVVLAILASALTAGVFAVVRIIHPLPPQAPARAGARRSDRRDRQRDRRPCQAPRRPAAAQPCADRRRQPRPQ
jgi:Co/Zn/Cd efflux system component